MARTVWNANPLTLMLLVWIGLVLYAGLTSPSIWVTTAIFVALGGVLAHGLQWISHRYIASWAKYGSAIIVALASTAVYYIVKPSMPHMEFLLALGVISVSVRFGLGPGLVTAFLSTLGALSVHFIFEPMLASEAMMQGVFLFVAALSVGTVVEAREKAVAAQTRLAQENAHQAQSLAQMVKQLERSWQSTLVALANALDARDRETAGHSARVTALAVRTAHQMGLDNERVRFIRWGALIHDIGKIGVSDAILRKPGALNDAEWAEMRRHPEIGYAILKNIPFLHPALDLVRYHHERCDGTGYPLGLAGETIPLAARIFAVADTYDAMTSDRLYRKARSRADTLAEIRQLAGAQFDPRVVQAFLALFQETTPVVQRNDDAPSGA